MEESRELPYHDDLPDSNSNLRMPQMQTLSVEYLLTASHQLGRQPLSRTMSSVADDSSVADSVSSVGQEEWEKVVPDESDADSDDELSRIPTPPADAQQTHESSLIFPAPVEDAAREEEDEPVEIRKPERIEEAQHDSGNGRHRRQSLHESQITFPHEPTDELSPQDGEFIFHLPHEAGSEAHESSRQPMYDGAYRMHMSRELFRPSRPLKLLYSGHESLQGMLEAKIGSVLVSARFDSEVLHRRQRYSVLPISWDKDSPMVELMPDSGAAMDVETCVAASELQVGRQIDLVLQSGHSIFSRLEPSTGKFYSTHGYQMPDLAIVVVSDKHDEDSSAAAVLKFLNRHNVPTLILKAGTRRKTRLGMKFIDPLLPHYTARVGERAPEESLVSERFPIFIDEFLRLNSLQLNKCLSRALRRPAKEHRTTVLQTLRREFIALELAFSRIMTEFAENRSLIAVSLVTLVLATFITALITTDTPLQSITFETPAASLQRTNTADSVQTVTIDAFPEATGHSPSLSLSDQNPKDLMSLVPKMDFKTVNPESFEAQVYGDNVVIVHPPRWFADMKRAPELSFKLLKDENRIVHNVTRLSNKIYALTIPKEHAHGLVDIHIQAPKWAKEQTLQVDLGSAWAKLFDWVRATGDISPSKDLKSKLYELSSLYSFNFVDILNATKWTRTFGSSSPLYSSIITRYEVLQRTFAESNRAELAKGALRVKAIKEESDRQLREFKNAIQKSYGKANEQILQWRQSHFREEQKELMKLWYSLTGSRDDAGTEKAGAGIAKSTDSKRSDSRRPWGVKRSRGWQKKHKSKKRSK